MKNVNQAVAREWDFEQGIAGFAMNKAGTHVAVALGDGNVALLEADDLVEEAKIMRVHDGVSLSLVADGDAHAWVSGGDDGKVFLIEPHVDVPTEIAHVKGKWIDHVAASAEGVRAFACGKQVVLLDQMGAPLGEPIQCPSSIGAMAFSPNGKRLAIAHYNGVSVFWTHAKERDVDVLPWKGSHIGLTWTDDSKILISSMQEGALHGWRLDDKAEMQMSGYATKIQSMKFSGDGKYLVTSGTDQIVCWPFFQGGPWNKQPLMLGGSDGRYVTCVAPHGRDPIVAAGYEDGMVVMAPMDGRMEIMLYPPTSVEGAGIVGMAWNADGDSLFVASEKGTLFLYTTRSVSRAVGR